MTGFVQAVEEDILDSVFSGWAGYEDLFVGLSTTTPTKTGTNITEPSTGAYARVQTDAADWAAAVGGAPSSKANSATLTFPAATGDWASGADFTHFVLFDALTTGNPVAVGTIATPKPVLEGDTAEFPPGSMVLRLGWVPDFE